MRQSPHGSFLLRDLALSPRRRSAPDYSCPPWRRSLHARESLRSPFSRSRPTRPTEGTNWPTNRLKSKRNQPKHTHQPTPLTDQQPNRPTEPLDNQPTERITKQTNERINEPTNARTDGQANKSTQRGHWYLHFLSHQSVRDAAQAPRVNRDDATREGDALREEPKITAVQTSLFAPKAWPNRPPARVMLHATAIDNAQITRQRGHCQA